METVLLYIVTALAVLLVVLVIALFAQKRPGNPEDVLRRLDTYEKLLGKSGEDFRNEFVRNREESSGSSQKLRQELNKSLLDFQTSVNAKFDSLTKQTGDSVTGGLSKFIAALSAKLDTLTKNTEDTLRKEQQEVQNRLQEIQKSNEQKLDQMRQTVDEKLQGTLETRLNNSFKLVSQQLEAVQKGLGEMQNLASDVGGLKRALSNVKVKGMVGEYQLETLLSEILTANQYEKNAHPNPEKTENVVEYAVKIPAKDVKQGYIYLPIDSKFPTASYEKLLADYDAADKAAVDADRKTLESDIRKFAKDVSSKYIETPYTTNFAIIFLPFESLYAEVIRVPNLFQQIQNDYHVTITGPTTLDAFLNSLQMGFRTLAIENETNHVWELLGAVRTQFGKFGEVLEATKKKLDQASKEIDNAGTRSRVIERKLREVEELPADKAHKVLELEGEAGDA